ncbi:MAG: hypothetical protein AAGM27_07870, partial [Cyanobacteria bacterium J06554_3]
PVKASIEIRNKNPFCYRKIRILKIMGITPQGVFSQGFSSQGVSSQDVSSQGVFSQGLYRGFYQLRRVITRSHAIKPKQPESLF